VWLATSIWFASRVFRLSGLALPRDWQENRAMARFGVQSHALTFVTRMHERGDVLLLALLLADPTPTGLYAIALTVPAVLAMVPESVSVAAYTALAGETDRGGADLTAFVVRNVLAWMLVLWAAFAATAGILLPLAFGDAYAAAVAPALLLAAALAPAAAHRVIMRYLVSSDRQPTTLRIYTAALVLNTVLNVALIPVFGIDGAATARLLSQTACAVVMVFVFVRITGISARRLLVPQMADLEAYRREADALLRRLSRP
jgi:O-antigen/teichoic acid export membrane protein